MNSLVLLHRSRDIITLTLNRPEKGNSLNMEAASELEARLKEIQKDPSCKALILRGAGEKFFCTGADLQEMREEEKREALVDYYTSLMSLLSSLPVLTAAFVNGDAVGGGLGLMVCCKYLLISDRARIGVPHIQTGLVPYALLPSLLSRFGKEGTLQLILGGRLLAAEDLLGTSLQFEKTSPEEFDSRAQQLTQIWGSWIGISSRPFSKASLRRLFRLSKSCS